MQNINKISNSRKILFSVFLLLLVLIIFEIFAQLAFKSIYGHSYRPAKLHQLTSNSWVFNQDDVGVPGHLSDLVIHPYFGFAINSQSDSSDELGFGSSPSALDSPQHKDKLRVLVLGGSVAVQLALRHGDEQISFLEQALQETLRRQNIDLDVWMVSAALPGFKQPQQFFSYSYLMALGAEFDLIINIDGFNEMTLAVLEGRSKGLYPAYPRGWDVLLGNQTTAANLRQVGQLLRVRDEQASLLEFSQSTPLARSAILGLVLAYKIIKNETRANSLVSEIEHRKQEGKLSFEAGGLNFDYGNEEKTYQYLAKLWSNSSNLLSQLVSSNESTYLQVFQPNQYLQGSKILSELERSKYFVTDDGFGEIFQKAYPYFNVFLKKMRSNDNWFMDTSLVFENESRTVYSDVCCHFNELGLEILANHIANDAISKSHKAQSHAP